MEEEFSKNSVSELNSEDVTLHEQSEIIEQEVDLGVNRTDSKVLLKLEEFESTIRELRTQLADKTDVIEKQKLLHQKEVSQVSTSQVLIRK